MSYGHAGNLAGEPSKPPGQLPGEAPPERLDPALLDHPDVRAAATAHKIGTLYRVLQAGGTAQRTIAKLTGQSQSEVCEILKGRDVGRYEVLARICTGLGLPRELMGLSWYGPDGAYAGGVTVADPPKGVTSGMRRRGVVLLGAVAAFGEPVLGALLGRLPGPAGSAELPNRLDWHHVERVRDTTRRLGVIGHGSYPDPDVCRAAAASTDRLLGVTGAEPVRRALLTAAAELHIEAGWAAFEALLHDRALHHFDRALEAATQAGDYYCAAVALNSAGMVAIESGHPDDGLKMLQLALPTAWRIPDDDRRVVVVGEVGKAAVQSTVLADSVVALSALGCDRLAVGELSKSRDLWQPTPADPFGDPERVAARFELGRGRLDIAEQYAGASVRRWEGSGYPIGRTRSGLVLATVYVAAGEPKGLTMAKTVIDAVARLDSPRTRGMLVPLADALAARPGADARELARAARKVAATAV